MSDPHRTLVCYLPLGDPEAAGADARLYADLGVDYVEVGVPVADPTLDGPEVTASMQRALAVGMTSVEASAVLADQMSGVSGDVQAVWMSYCADPSAAYLADIANSGARNVLLPDADLVALDRQAEPLGLNVVPFLDHQPLAGQIEAARGARSYVMLAAASGVTGMRTTVDPGNAATIASLRVAGVDAPIALGFGISTTKHVRAAIDMGADGVIVGSACLRAARSGKNSLVDLIGDLRKALDD